MKLPISVARDNDEVISVSDNSIIRYLDRLHNTDCNQIEEMVKACRKEIKEIRNNSVKGNEKRKIKSLFQRIDELQFIPDYMSLIIDTKKDYDIACKGFMINGIRYRRLLGTTNGVKQSTIIFVAERCGEIDVYNKIVKMIDNERKMDKPIIPAKLEAYKALAFSASALVTQPRGVLVVDDCVTHFKDNFIQLSNQPDGEPICEYKENQEVELVDSDGYGLISPELAMTWSKDLKYNDEIIGGFGLRNSYCKGMLFTFDFKDFFKNVVHKEIVKDVWGNEHNINDIDIILTTSMLKLWDFYDSIEDYLFKSYTNGHKFCVTKTAETKLRNVRRMNYQFLQGYELSDNEITELCKQSIDDITGVLGGDIDKAIIFLKGEKQSEKSVPSYVDDCFKALMINPKVFNDSYVQYKIIQLVKKKIKEMKIGKILVDGDFSIVSGDPYSLCQSIAGVEVTGLLKRNEIYNKYWVDKNATEVCCFRAPMSCMNNIRKMKLHYSSEADYWYRYMNTISIINSWDMFAHAENGLDKDGDTIMITDNEIILRNTNHIPAIVCVQNKADKKIPVEEDFIKANKIGFGDDIGIITNYITSMYEVRNLYDENSPEYKELTYRIMCGQLIQQDSIDKVKGVKVKPMEKYWYNRSSAYKRDNDLSPAILNADIVADKKPYFMIYRYDNLRKKYKNYIKSANAKSILTFGKNINELINSENLTDEEFDFLSWYNKQMPVGISDCTMNRICRYIEKETSNCKIQWANAGSTFDYSIYKTNKPYNKDEYNSIINEVVKGFNEFMEYCNNSDIKDDLLSISNYKQIVMENIKRNCKAICQSDEDICNILVDFSYSTSAYRYMVWSICGEQLIQNLLNHSERKINYYELDDNGEIKYNGMKYSRKEMII